MTSTTPVHDGEGQRPSDDRLDSWKEIAAFLHRDVRTVQRWEKQSGLPVHRPADSRLRTAYAFRSELEAWWRAQNVTTVGAGRDADPPSAAIPKRWWALAIILPW
jgi:hypothetical protein